MVSEVKPDRDALMKEIQARIVRQNTDKLARQAEAKRKEAIPAPLTDYQRAKKRREHREAAASFQSVADANDDPMIKGNALMMVVWHERAMKSFLKKPTVQPKSAGRKRRYKNQTGMLAKID